MTTRWKFIHVALLFTALSLNPAYSQDDEDDDEGPSIGCSILAGSVGTAVHIAITQGELNLGMQIFAGGIAAGAGVVTYEACDHAVETTTEAFDAAMYNLGYNIRWGTFINAGSGDVCLSHHLSQCYPFQELNDQNQWSAAETAFIMDAWDATRSAVDSLTPFGLGGDSITFNMTDMSSAFQNGYSNNMAGSLSVYENAFPTISPELGGHH